MTMNKNSASRPLPALYEASANTLNRIAGALMVVVLLIQIAGWLRHDFQVVLGGLLIAWLAFGIKLLEGRALRRAIKATSP